jgi:hypothetical protein
MYTRCTTITQMKLVNMRCRYADGRSRFRVHGNSRQAPSGYVSFELNEADLQTVRVGAFFGPARKLDAVPVEALETLPKHGTIDLSAQPWCDVDDATRVDAQDIAIVGKMVDRAERQAIDDRGDSLGICVVDDVGRLDERLLAERADRAPATVRT